ncbi:spore germination protein [Cohnella sp. GCM10027633]|uniref:spore germination protein n=1 Tax=unclassified Cohnella TaxID=2636738 RepID=UPI003625BD6D
MQRTEDGVRLTLRELTSDKLRWLFRSNRDVRIHPYYDDEAGSRRNPYLVYCTGMIDAKLLNDFLYGQLNKLLSPAQGIDDGSAPIDSRHMERIEEPGAVSAMIDAVFSGNLVLYFADEGTLFRIGMSNPPQRLPSESSTEISIKGPRDGFTEELDTNVALIRKRLKSTSLAVEYYELGRRTKTSLALLYMTDITNGEIVNEARLRLSKIDVDGIVSGQQLESALSDNSLSMFPLVEYMGRPDFAVESLLRGRFVVVVNGNPMVLIAPTNLMSLIKSPEDAHSPYYYVTIERMLRMLGLVTALFLPGFWVAVSAFNLDQIPFPLLATITVSRLGLPLSGPIDLFLMLGLFELFREAGMRLPKAVGQTVAVVGGLIVGDAAISAGLTGPTTLVISAVTAVSTFTLVNQSLSGSVTVIRFAVLTLSSLFGMLGFFISMYLIVLYLSSLTSFGVPYMAPLSPISFKDVGKGLFAIPWRYVKRRPRIYKTQDSTRQGDDS